jgi:hypothetical protein
MESQKIHRKASGRRVEGHSLAVRIAQEVKGKILAHAFMVIKSAGFQLLVNKLDGVPHGAVALQEGQEVISVDVISGIVSKSWASPDNH